MFLVGILLSILLLFFIISNQIFSPFLFYTRCHHNENNVLQIILTIISHCRPVGEKYDKAREWKVPVVSVQWLNDVMFGSVNAAQCMSNAKYQVHALHSHTRLGFCSFLFSAEKQTLNLCFFKLL